ncbi:transposable element Tc1 transposase [Trichonephila clavipes]|nr:transposable element Tc1 transposase [Trichonephila clavipes]
MKEAKKKKKLSVMVSECYFRSAVTNRICFYAWPNYWKDRRRAKNTDVAKEFDIAHSVVSRLWKSFKTTGICSRRHGGGRVRSTTPAEDRYIVLSAKRNRRTTAQQVANQFLAASGKQISRKIVARRLRGGGLYARRPVVCVPMTRQHRTARLQWCREHHNWTEQDWACVLFSDESSLNRRRVASPRVWLVEGKRCGRPLATPRVLCL